MTWFFTRVVLQGEAPDYDALDGAMTQQGFTRTINEGGKLYRLPQGHYFSAYGDARTTAAMIRNQALEIGRTVAADCWVLVAKPIDWAAWIEPAEAGGTTGGTPDPAEPPATAQ